MKRILKAINEGISFPKKLIDFSAQDDKPLQKTNYQDDHYIKYLFEEWLNEEDTPLTKTIIYEFLKSNKNYYAPKDKQELSKLIHRAIEGQGENVDLNWINTGNMTDMSELFFWDSFNGDISRWDVSNVKNMHLMFNGSSFNGDISKWNVSQVENMEAMFQHSKFNGDISQWDVHKVITMKDMFHCAAFNGDISKWDVSRVTDMSEMFSGDRREGGTLINYFNNDLSGWDVSRVKNMSLMFCCSKFNGDISKWDVSRVTDMSGMFSGYTDQTAGITYKTRFNGDISQWNVSRVTDMLAMFYNSEFDGDLSQWNVGNVQNMANMFNNSNFHGDISGWNFKKCKSMLFMFNNVPNENINTILSMLNKIDPIRNNINLDKNITLFADVDRHKINMEDYNNFISDKNGNSYTSRVKFIDIIFQEAYNKLNAISKDPKNVEDTKTVIELLKTNDKVTNNYSIRQSRTGSYKLENNESIFTIHKNQNGLFYNFYTILTFKKSKGIIKFNGIKEYYIGVPYKSIQEFIDKNSGTMPSPKKQFNTPQELVDSLMAEPAFNFPWTDYEGK